MARKRASKSKLSYTHALLILMVALLGAWLSYSAIGPSHMGDDINAYIWEAHRVSIGAFQETNYDIFSTRLLQDMPIGFFYWLMGPGILSSALWDIITFVLSVVLVFYIGKELYDEKVGLLAAFLMATFPMAVIYSLTMSDNLPMMFFSSLAMYLLLVGIKRNSRKHLFLSGMAFISVPLTTPEGAVLIVVALAYLILLLAIKRGFRKMNLVHILSGAAVAIAILLIYNYANSGNPLITLTAAQHFYGAVGQPNTIPYIDSNPNFYFTVMFPYNLLASIWNSPSAPYLLNGFSTSAWIWTNDSNLGGLYFYFLVAASAYLIIIWDKRAIFPLFWFAVGFAYLEFGPLNITLNPFSYIMLHRLDRFLLLITPPMVIIMSAGFLTIVRRSRKRFKPVAIIACALGISLMVSVSLGIIWYVHEEQLAQQYPILTEAKYLMRLPNTTKIYLDGGYADLEVYMGFNNFSRFDSTNPESLKCGSLPFGSYMLIPSISGYSGPYGFTPNDIANCSGSVEVQTRYGRAAAAYGSIGGDH